MRRCAEHDSTDLTPDEVAIILNKGYRTILQWMKSGVFGNERKCERCGCYLISSKSVDEYIESLKI